MSVELRPLGVKCNIECQYCYQNPQRDAGNLPHSYNLEVMKSAVEREGGPFTLFGGEPLMLPEKDLVALWSWGLERYGQNNLQTNGTLIGESHLALFRRYKVHVGISVDGPGELNDVRWAGTLEATRRATEKTHRAIDRLCREGMPPSLIITLHRGNATADKIPVMLDWFRYLQCIGIRSARLHVLESEDESIRAKYALTTEENVAAFLAFLDFEASELRTLRLDVFHDMRNLLAGRDDNVTCIWNACDPYTTRAVRGVEGNGQTSNCGRTNKDGIDFIKASTEGFERYLALYFTPQEYNGCKGCRFFLMCKGQCPGTAVDGDWRNRTEHCDFWKTLYSHLERQATAQGLAPISLRPDRQRIESLVVDSWKRNQNLSIAGALGRLQQVPAPVSTPAAHGDSPHGDSHGDHTDAALLGWTRQHATA